MDARAIIAEIRNGRTPTPEAIAWFAQGLANGAVSDAQAGAFAMAVCLRGLSEPGRVALTQAMRDTGDVLHWDLPGPTVDKHSTGGVGDCVSLVLAPALAACGAYVPMISGRGLGHTGGTLDKLEAIPGVNTEVSQDRLREIVADIGCAVVSATGDIAPADKRLYGIRDVTATVESIDLITASIISKKLAAGPEALVLDVKTGSGAFMQDLSDARVLAQSLVDTANGAGCNTVGLITNMSQPNASSLGNALEIMEVMKALTNPTPSPLIELAEFLGAVVLVQAELADTPDKGAQMIRQAIFGGKAAEVFGQMVAALGGPKDFVSRWRDRLPAAPKTYEVFPVAEGRVVAMDGTAMGMAVVHLGGGRLVGSDVVNPAVGLSQVARLGDVVDAHSPIALVHADNEAAARRAANAISGAITIAPTEAEFMAPPLVIERVG